MWEYPRERSSRQGVSHGGERCPCAFSDTSKEACYGKRNGKKGSAAVKKINLKNIDLSGIQSPVKKESLHVPFKRTWLAYRLFVRIMSAEKSLQVVRLKNQKIGSQWKEMAFTTEKSVQHEKRGGRRRGMVLEKKGASCEGIQSPKFKISTIKAGADKEGSESSE